jgi:protein Tex
MNDFPLSRICSPDTEFDATDMNDLHIRTISSELSLSPHRVGAAAALLDSGATVPFIARYRKEATGGLDEVAIAAVRDRMEQLAALDDRREAILGSLEERGLLTDDLRTAIESAETLAVLEDIYLPYRPKRRTRATMARERGLEPLAALIFAQGNIDPEAEAAAFIDPEKDVHTVEDALDGARDIIAEWVSEDAAARARMRDYFAARAILSSRALKGKEAEGATYRDWFDWSEPAAEAPSHRILAIRRGESAGILSLRVMPPEEGALAILDSIFVKGDSPASRQVRLAAHDSYDRLLGPSMETEIRSEMKERADAEAIRVFAENLRHLLLAPPLGEKTILAVDPGLRTGCKICVLSRQGALLHHDVIFLHQSEALQREGTEKVRKLVRDFAVEVIAVGNGTAGRETEAFLRTVVDIPVVMVNESGASIYSASEAAREEFPDQDVTVRGAVSIGRRLMDPLAELVKIDPKSIGVGQYQHDVDQGKLMRGLDDAVESCVNGVGVELNTASPRLMSYVSGLGPKLARNIAAFREEHGPFRSRDELKKVPRLGGKAFEQAAGFLRIRNGAHPLDASAVHPESYPIVDRMARDLGCTVGDLMRDESLRKRIELSRYVTATVGMPTLADIMEELAKPGRDPRDRFEPFSFAEGVRSIEDLRPGMKLPGIVTNVAAFGAFVDIGVHQDGLIHKSQLADKFVKDPSEIVSVGRQVTVTVVEIDLDRRRISLSLKSDPFRVRAGVVKTDARRGTSPK